MRWLFLVALALLTCLGACGGLAPSPGRAEAHDERDEEAVEERAEADSVVDTAVVDGEQVADADGDRIVDAADACPQEAEAYNGSDDEDGCPDCANHIILTEAWGPPVIRFADDGTEAIFPSDLDFMAAVVVVISDLVIIQRSTRLIMILVRLLRGGRIGMCDVFSYFKSYNTVSTNYKFI